MDDTRLGTLLLESNVVREEDLEKCLEIQALTGGSRPLGQILVEQNVITADELEELLELQQERRAGAMAPLGVDKHGGERFVRAAAAAGATDLFLSEGKPTMVRLAGKLRALEDEPLQAPEVWQFLRDYMGNDALEVLAERKSLTREFHREGIGHGRIMAFRHFDGACVSLRLHPDEIRTAEESGLSEQAMECITTNRGLVLITGEVRSGITSTMATILSSLVQNDSQLIFVLDENQEYELPQGNAIVISRRVGVDIKDYEAGLQSAIQEEPDVIMLADASAPETFDLALRAAEGGRLVIAALHAQTVQAALARAMNFYSASDLPRIRGTLASVLKCVLRLQLVPDMDGLGQIMATELLIVDGAAREVIRGGMLAKIGLLLNMKDTKSGHSMDACLEKLLQSKRITFEDAFHLADDKSRILKLAKSKPRAEARV